jgi:hypothetical protein
VNGSNNRIGMPGVGPAFQTLVSGNTLGEIGVKENNIVQNCLVGTDVTGTKVVSGGSGGIVSAATNLHRRQLDGGNVIWDPHGLSGRGASLMVSSTMSETRSARPRMERPNQSVPSGFH